MHSHHNEEITMKTVLDWVRSAESAELNEIFLAAIQRQAILFPDWETILINLPKHDIAQRNTELDNIYAFLKRNFPPDKG